MGMQDLALGRLYLWLCAAAPCVEAPELFQEPEGVAATSEGETGRKASWKVSVLPSGAGTPRGFLVPCNMLTLI